MSPGRTPAHSLSTVQEQPGNNYIIVTVYIITRDARIPIVLIISPNYFSYSPYFASYSPYFASPPAPARSLISIKGVAPPLT